MNKNHDIFIEKDGVEYSLQDEQKTASIVGLRNFQFSKIIPRSIYYKSNEYVITQICETNSTYQYPYINFSPDTEIQVIKAKSFLESKLLMFSHISPNFVKVFFIIVNFFLMSLFQIIPNFK